MKFSRTFQHESLKTWQNATVNDLPLNRTYERVLSGFSFFHAFEKLARTGAPRLCVVNPDQTICSVITQSTMIQYINNQKHLLGAAVRNCRVADIKTKLAPFTTNDQQRPLTAFRLMSDNSLTGTFGGFFVEKKNDELSLQV